jgi:hypothetical protein
MHRLSARNTLAWLGGAAGVLAIFALQMGLVNGWIGAIVIGLAVVGAGTWVALRVSEYVHGRRLAEFALTHGWTYQPDGYGLTMGLTGFPFAAGSERTMTDVISGRYDGRECSSYTLTVRQSAGDNKKVEQVFTVTQTRLDYPVPRLDIVPEDIGTRIAGAVAGTDIELESAEFNRTWHVQCADRRFAVDFIDPRMMQGLLNHRLPGVAVRIEGDKIAVWSAGRTPVDALARRFDLVTGIARRIPAHVARSYSEADAQRRAEQEAREANAPTWANTGGVLNSGRYTGIGTDADGDGIEDWEQRTQ